MNFYSLLYYLLQKRRDVQNRRRHLDTTNSSTNHGHHHASDFIYASPYELIEKHHNQTSEDINNNNPSEIYIPGSVSIRLTPPPLPQRNNNYTPMPSPTNFGMSQTNVMPNSRASSATTPPISRAFPNTPSPIIANNELKVVIEVHNEDRRASSLQQLQDFLESNNLSIPQEKDGFLSRKVGYEIERRLVKAVQVRTLKKKKQKKGHYHYYPFYEKENNKGLWNWLKRHLAPEISDPVYNNNKKKRRTRRRKHHRFCLKCVTSSFKSLFRVLKEPLANHLDNEEYVGAVPKEEHKTDAQKRAHSRAATEVTRTPTPKMLLDMTTGAIHWPVYQVGGQSGSGMLLSTKGLKKQQPRRNSDELKEEPGRENFSLVGQSDPSFEEMTSKQFLAATDNYEKKLIGWLQVRDPNNKKSFLQVVNPAPEGPFRKAPWHGNVHVMKF